MKVYLAHALEEAQRLVECMKPVCEKVEIAGSIRRGASEVKDIEIVCIPKTINGGLFGDMQERDPEFAKKFKGCKVNKGNFETGKYIQFETHYTMRPRGDFKQPCFNINVDLFTARAENWGLIMAIRTGSAKFSHYKLAGKWSALGYMSVNGMLTKNGEEIPIYDEKQLFELLGMNYVDPCNREVR